jgi:carbamoyltransferase
MIILGLSCLSPSGVVHDVTAALVIDGKLRSAVSEDRFTGIKHHIGYPSLAIKSCLESEGLQLSDVDAVSVGYGLLKDKMNRSTISQFYSRAEKLKLFKETPMRKKDPKFYDHEYIHAKTGYFFSGFKQAVVVSLDGGGVDNGKFVSGGIFVIDDGKVEIIRMYPLSATIGWTYGAFTEACGFRIADGEGKTMSLAAFALNENQERKTKIYELTKRIFPKYDKIDYVGGGIEYPIWYEEHNEGFANFGDSRLVHLTHSFSKELVAWAGQRVLEETLVDIISSAVEHTGIRNVILTGGVFFNMIANMIIRKNLEKMGCSVFINPVCGDMGNAVGAALEEYYEETGRIESTEWPSLSLGPEYTDEQIELSLSRMNLKYSKVNSVSTAIDLIEKGKITGWFQGKSELGPRALGNRSILSRVDSIQFKDMINERVKHRESWRPFCPTIIEEKSDYYLEDPTYAPYMILGFKMKHEENAPAISHIDGTTRPQTLRRESNEKFYDVVKGAGGILLNTSLNLAGDPLNSTPDDALRTFKYSGMDALIIGNFLVQRHS